MVETLRRGLAALAWFAALGLVYVLLFPPLAVIGAIATLCALPVMIWRRGRNNPTETPQ